MRVKKWITALVLFLILPGAVPRKINEWQHIDQRSALVFPWFTKSFLDVLVDWDIKDWDVFEWGSGYSTIWFGNNCRSVVSVDHNAEWISSLKGELDVKSIGNVTLKHRLPSHPLTIGEGGELSAFVNAIDEDHREYDCIIIDSEYHRNTCAFHVLNHIKDGGIVILDNANQATVGLNSEKTFELFKDYEHHSFLQAGHPDWRTDYWVIRKNSTK